MSVYSARLGMAIGFTGETTLFTASSEYTTVVRDITICNHSGSGSQAYCVILQVSGSQAIIWNSGVLAEDTTAHLECRVVMNPGDELVCFPLNGANAGDIVVSGYQLG